MPLRPERGPRQRHQHQWRRRSQAALQGFDALHFGVRNGDTLLFDQQFTDTAAALAFFSGFLDLGDVVNAPLIPQLLDLHFFLELTGTSGSGFGARFAVGTTPIPEPATAAMVCLGLIALSVARRLARS